jgi:hypothetical protein
MSIDKIAKLTKAAAEALNDSETFFTAVLAKKASYLSEQYPSDSTMRSVAQVLSSTKDLIISRKKLKDLYNGFYSCNTKFASFFRDELDYKEQAQNIVPQITHTEVKPFDMHAGADQATKQVLDAMLGNPVSQVLASKDVCDSACKRVGFVLNQMVPGVKVRVAAADSKYVVAAASFETNRGKLEVFVPMEVKASGLADAGIFAGNGVFSMTKENLSKYIEENAGKPLQMTASQLLDAVKVSGASKELNLKQSTAAQDAADKFAKAKKLEASVVDTYSFQKKFSTDEGMAELHFGVEKVAQARHNVFAAVKKAGHTPKSMKVLAFSPEGVQVGVMLDGGVSFTVPVSIREGVVKQASVMVQDGGVKTVSKETIDELYEAGKQDLVMASKMSTFAGTQYDDLVQIVRTAAKQKDYTKAEEALNVISQTASTKDYALAFQVYKEALLHKEHVCKCSKQITVANGARKICGHTGLPLDRVVQDEFGNCVPAYHKDLAKLQPQSDLAYKAFRS